MPSLSPDRMPELCSALMRLRGETQSSVSANTAIRKANLSVWLRGKDQVISAKRVIPLLRHLGVEGGRLRRDMLHVWSDTGGFSSLKTVIDLLQLPPEGTWLFTDRKGGPNPTSFVRIGQAWIRLQISPGLTDLSDVSDLINAEKVFTADERLEGISTVSQLAAVDALTALAERGAFDISNEDLAELTLGLTTAARTIQEKDSQKEFSQREYPAQEWQQLAQALRSALQAGLPPAAIAAAIDNVRTT